MMFKRLHYHCKQDYSSRYLFILLCDNNVVTSFSLYDFLFLKVKREESGKPAELSEAGCRSQWASLGHSHFPSDNYV